MTQKVFTPEKVRELAVVMSETPLLRDKEIEITKWLEQNPIEPVVVGLSDEQLYDFYTSCEDFMGLKIFLREYKEWAKTQTFTQPNPSEKEVVGLDDGQVKKLAAFINTYEGNTVGAIRTYLSQQAFAQPNSFEPNWGDAPYWADWLAQDECGIWNFWEERPKLFNESYSSKYTRWYDGKRASLIEDSLSKNWQQTLQQRPKPTPQVEVGQVWKCATNQSDYIIKGIATLEGETKTNDGDWESNIQLVAYSPEKACEVKTYRRTIEDFLAKFERVGGGNE